jgi:hypothetical protein
LNKTNSQTYIKKVNDNNNLNIERIIYVILNFQYMFLFSRYTSHLYILIIFCEPHLFQLFLISVSKGKMTFKLKQTPNIYWVGHNRIGQSIFQTFAPNTWVYMVLRLLWMRVSIFINELSRMIFLWHGKEFIKKEKRGFI